MLSEEVRGGKILDDLTCGTKDHRKSEYKYYKEVGILITLDLRL